MNTRERASTFLLGKRKVFPLMLTSQMAGGF
ncbi:hypothetical protein MNBD_NITROSPINAE01-496 [hydrothermal vent metagenome]|uniref:Uncharacterized protein n=1 Tax=hydrothermal vent metagenome TaxID=652676 RepID=A0A3B1CIP0_9ZZZZ